jgi:hypothetical protein
MKNPTLTDIINDPEHQDIVNTLNNMARAALEKDEKAYEAFYFSAMEQVDELNERLCKHAGFNP